MGRVAGGRGILGTARREDWTDILVLMLVIAEEKFIKLACREKIQKLVVCLEVFMKVSIDEERVMDMVQAMKGLLSNNELRQS